MMNRSMDILACKRNDSHRIPRPTVFSGKGFTLIELLVVIAIISLLVSILLPSLNKAKQLAGLTACSANERAIGIASQMYTHENDGWLVPAVSGIYNNVPWNHLLTNGGYTETSVFRCPSHQSQDPTVGNEDLRSYIINAWITSDVNISGNPYSKHMKYDEAETYHGGSNMCLLNDAWRMYYSDGSIVENTLGGTANNLCWQLYPWNNGGGSEHTPEYLVNFLFLDGHVDAYKHDFYDEEHNVTLWPSNIYSWYVSPYF